MGVECQANCVPPWGGTGDGGVGASRGTFARPWSRPAPESKRALERRCGPTKIIGASVSVFATISAQNTPVTMGNQMRRIEDTKAKRLAELTELKEQLAAARGRKSRGTMSWRGRMASAGGLSTYSNRSLGITSD